MVKKINLIRYSQKGVEIYFKVKKNRENDVNSRRNCKPPLQINKITFLSAIKKYSHITIVFILISCYIENIN